MNEYSLFNPIMLNFFEVSNAFHVCIWVVYTVWYVPASVFVRKHI